MARQRKKEKQPQNERVLATTATTEPRQQSHSTQGQRQSARIRGTAPEFSDNALYQDTRRGKRDKQELVAASRSENTRSGNQPARGRPKGQKAHLQSKQFEARSGLGSKKQKQGKPASYKQPLNEISQPVEINQDQTPAQEHRRTGFHRSRLSPGFKRILERSRITYFRPELLRQDSDGEDTSSRSSMTSHSQVTIQTQTTMKKRKDRIKPEHSDFDECMYARNVDVEECEPRDKDEEIRRQVVPSSDKLAEVEGGTHHIRGSWDVILTSMRRKNEMHFTMTIFFNLINMYKDFLKGGNLDHATDRLWNRHDEPPSRDPELLASKPKPDIFIGFKPSAILLRSRFFSLGKELRKMMMPAETEAEDSGVAFPFLIMEAKGPSAKLGSSPLARQVVNDASHALHNLWRFFQRAGEEEKFFDHVRIFTLAGSSERMTVRMHYALQEQNSDDWVNKDYPLKFQYEVLISQSTDAANCRLLIQNVLTNILSYAEGTMLRQIQQAVGKVLNKFDQHKALGENGLQTQALEATSSETPQSSSPPDPERGTQVDLASNKRRNNMNQHGERAKKAKSITESFNEAVQDVALS